MRPLALVALTGCATLIPHHRDGTLMLSNAPPDLEVTVDGKPVKVEHVQDPETGSVGTGIHVHPSRSTQKVVFRAQGREVQYDATSSIGATWIALDFFVGGILSGFLIDYLTGAWRSADSDTIDVPQLLAEGKPAAGTAAASVACSELSSRVPVVFQFAAADARGPQLAQAFVARCDHDAWTQDAKACFASAPTPEQMGNCFRLLTKAQGDALDHDGDAVMKGGAQ